ncbi:MAG: SOS response-associated peptidase [Acidobacteriota bacterium]|nr:SOS response-associated peptidase [Acidobacteriota bacterium]
MCGRFGLELPAQTIAEFFLAYNLQDVKPRYNIAPTQEVLCIMRDNEAPGNHASSFYWGLVPPWAKDMKIASKLTNARSETLREKPSFRGAFKYRRCLIPVSGFYEWERKGKHKQAWYFRPQQDNTPFAFAGLWEHWTGPHGEELWSCTIITTDANDVMSPVHHRMPVILGRDHFDAWLDLNNRNSSKLQPLLKPCPNESITGYRVGNYVNKAGNEGPQCIAPMQEPRETPPDQLELF